MKELKGSRTEANLMAAFAGESQARNKYDYFASQAKKDGYEQIAAKVIKAIEKDLDQSSGLGKVKAFFAAIIEWFKSLFAKVTGVFSHIGG